MKHVNSSDSMIKELKIKQFSLHIRGGKVCYKTFPAVKTKQPNHHAEPSLDI